MLLEAWRCLQAAPGCTALHCAALPWCGFGAVFLRRSGRVLSDEAAATQSGEMVLGTRNAWLNCAERLRKVPTMEVRVKWWPVFYWVILSSSCSTVLCDAGDVLYGVVTVQRLLRTIEAPENSSGHFCELHNQVLYGILHMRCRLCKQKGHQLLKVESATDLERMQWVPAVGKRIHSRTVA